MDSMTTLKSSSLYSELHALPLLTSAGEAYVRMKDSSRIATAGLTVLEYSCTVVLEKLYDGSKVAKGVDELAGKGMAKLIDKYPALSKSPEELQEDTTSVLKRAVQRVMKTPPGQTLLKGLDWALDKTERLLKSINPKPPKSPRKKRMTRSAFQKADLSKERAYALDDSGACDSDTRLTRPPSDAIPAAVDRLAEPRETLLNKVFRLTCVIPLEATVTMLKATRRYAGGGKRRKSTIRGDQSPDSRRKVSPRKKVVPSFLGKLRSRAYGFLGYSDVSKKIKIEELKGATSPVKAEEDDDNHEKKRKHDEIMTDPDSESDSAEEEFDIETYESGEDVDFLEPTEESESELSDDLSDGDTESEVEVEMVGTSGLVQLKEHPKVEDAAGVKDKKDVNGNKDVTAEAPKKKDDTTKHEKNAHKKAPEKLGDPHLQKASEKPGGPQHQKVSEKHGGPQHQKMNEKPGGPQHQKAPEKPGDAQHQKAPEKPGDTQHQKAPEKPGDAQHQKAPEKPGDAQHQKAPDNKTTTKNQFVVITPEDVNKHPKSKVPQGGGNGCGSPV